MASEAGVNEPSLLQRLISSRNRDTSLFMPIILGFTTPRRDSTDSTPLESRGRIIFINPLTQGTVVIEGSSSSLDSLLRDILNKDGQPPASKASIEAMPSVEEIGGEDEVSECVICLEEWVVGGVAKEMPCKHRFHGECIEKWLGIHGSCPVCRYKMPVDDDDDEDVNKKSGGDGDERERTREIWVSFSLNRRERSGESDQTPITDSNDSSSPPRPDHTLDC